MVPSLRWLDSGTHRRRTAHSEAGVGRPATRREGPWPALCGGERRRLVWIQSTSRRTAKYKADVTLAVGAPHDDDAGVCIS